MNRVSFNLPSFEVESELMVQDMFGYYDHQKVKLSVHIFCLNSVFKQAWIIQVYGGHHVFQDLLAKAEMPGNTELYSVMKKADSMAQELAAARREVAV